jgi:hypothetical protein
MPVDLAANVSGRIVAYPESGINGIKGSSAEQRSLRASIAAGF